MIHSSVCVCWTALIRAPILAHTPRPHFKKKTPRLKVIWEHRRLSQGLRKDSCWTPNKTYACGSTTVSERRSEVRSVRGTMLRREQEVEDSRVIIVSISQEAEAEDDLEVFNAEDEEERGRNPLTKACSDGNTLRPFIAILLQHLLQAGADETLCNGSKKTALRVSPPGVQKNLLGLMWWPCVAPRPDGDLRTVQQLLIQTGKLEANVPNGDGGTSVTFAIRDIDRFEGEAPLPWQHRPIQVVKQLLRLSANFWVQDQRGSSAFCYLANINGRLKEDFLHMILDAISFADAGAASPLTLEEHRSGQDLNSELRLLDLKFDPESLSDQSAASSPTQLISPQDLFLAYSEETFASSGCQRDHWKSPREGDKEDEESPHRVQNAAETLMDLTQASREGMTESRVSLPSLNSKCSRRRQMDPVPSSRQLVARSNRRPVPPTHRQRTRSVAEASTSSFGLLSVPDPSKLSQSAPSIMEPLLCANYVLQARTHIQTRLGPHDPINQQKGKVLALQPAPPFWMPNQLEPLDLRLRDNSAASTQKESVSLKPITRSSLSRTHLRQRFSWDTPGTSSLTTRGGREDSSSSANFTDPEDEDYEGHTSKNTDLMFTKAKDPKHPKDRWNELCNGEMRQSLKSQSKSSSISLVQKSTCIPRPEPVNCPAQDYNRSPTRDLVKHKTSIPSKPNYYINNGCTRTTKQESPTIKGYFVGKPTTAKDFKIGDELSSTTEGTKLNSNSAVEETQLKCPINKSTDLSQVKVKKTFKPVQSTTKETTANCEVRPNLPKDRLAPKDRSILNLNKAPKKLSLANKSTDGARRSLEQIGTEEVTETLSKSKSKHKAVNRTRHTHLLGNRGTVSAHARRGNPDEVCNSTAQQCPTASELKNAQQFKSPEAAGLQRSKSAVDFITYKDMFTTIQSEGKGPAIYEMFAGPIYDHLRNPIKCEDKKMQSPLCRKSRENSKVKHRSLKQVHKKTMSMDLAALHGSGLDDTITWTKGEVLGRGAYGTVYCGLTNQGQLIAVKQVTLDASNPEAARREYSRLQGEVKLLKTLSHTNIVGFLGTSLYRHMVSIFMEYIPGGSIASILHRFGPLPERVLALYTHQILKGVAYLHLNEVIHRDLKGNNVMLMPTGVIKLVDFGCARRVTCVSNTTNGSGDLLKSLHGTPYWMAPEVISETGYGRKSDIWSVGCTVYEMATGKPPLAHMDKIAALFYIGAKRGLMPSLPEGFSEGAKEFVNICLTRDQSLRPSADQLLRHSFIPRLTNRTELTSWKARKNNFCGHPDGLCG
ncbi:uncharacterized protein map3k19 isoform X2 [Syngnathoides biaculeatus]|uniref:uncharacterized protein map3k19 isoform X2 n=1 Tax=Syngnathoides biaculeatus TaxID=300417 RepID=UPI002ADD9C23|nr:uncharacterized protein map3k19 isoform X2 [Syngnathoides biaculeatus]